jgi:hypothetical protein
VPGVEVAHGGLQCPPPPVTLHSFLRHQPMSITLTASYKDTLAAATVEKIDELLEENYFLDDMLEFIDERNETNFVEYYEEYVRCGEAIGYEAVEALIDENGECSCIVDCDERYRGHYHDEAEFAEEFYTETTDVPDGLVIDWQATYDSNLRYDFTSCNDGTSYRACHIFSDH